MLINQLLTLVDDHNLPGSRTIVTFEGKGCCVIFCDKIIAHFITWLEHAAFVDKVEYNCIKNEEAIDVSIHIKSGSSLVWSNVK